jgi:hypothetical protein
VPWPSKLFVKSQNLPVRPRALKEGDGTVLLREARQITFTSKRVAEDGLGVLPRIMAVSTLLDKSRLASNGVAKLLAPLSPIPLDAPLKSDRRSTENDMALALIGRRPYDLVGDAPHRSRISKSRPSKSNGPLSVTRRNSARSIAISCGVVSS